jgi:hypothetical protein
VKLDQLHRLLLAQVLLKTKDMIIKISLTNNLIKISHTNNLIKISHHADKAIFEIHPTTMNPAEVTNMVVETTIPI